MLMIVTSRKRKDWYSHYLWYTYSIIIFVSSGTGHIPRPSTDFQSVQRARVDGKAWL